MIINKIAKVSRAFEKELDLKRRVPAVSIPASAHAGAEAGFFVDCCQWIGYLMMESHEATPPHFNPLSPGERE
jgi:hypothetical protein